jgi:hypothetical protein
MVPYEEGSSDQTRVVPDSCSTIFRPFSPIQHHHILILVTINPYPFSEFFRSVGLGIYGVESEQFTLLY